MLLAVFVALWLGTFVDFLTRRRVPRVAAILTAYLALFMSILFLAFVALPPIVKQIDAGVRQLPGGIPKLRQNAVVRKYDDKYKLTRSWKAKRASFPAGSRPSPRSSPRSRSGHSRLSRSSSPS
jgi:predicted PurR-regulated permease PerM